MPTVVFGTAGHIDHGKTALLRALTGIDADRLPEERSRGMTIDVGYAHLDLPDGTSLDFVDVPGHDRLVGNMLVGAGEIDAALVVVAADDGFRAQTLEHLELLDGLGLRDGLAVITKIDLVEASRVGAVMRDVEGLLARTSLAGAPILAVSAVSGTGIDRLVDELRRVRDRVAVRALTRPAGPVRIAIDRVFTVRGRGTVVTGTLRGGTLAVGDHLRVEPGGGSVRARGMEIHNTSRDRADGGRTAVNVAGADADTLHRGQVLTVGAGIEASQRVLVGLRGKVPPKDGAVLRLHLGTAQVEATVGLRGIHGASLPEGARAAILRLEVAVATFVGDRGVLRRSSPAEVIAGVQVLDPMPPRGISRRRLTLERLANLAVAIDAGDAEAAVDALTAIHGALPSARSRAVTASLRAPGPDAGSNPPAGGGLILAPDVTAALERAAIDRVAGHAGIEPLSAGLPLGELRSDLLRGARQLITIDRSAVEDARAAIDAIVDGLVARNRLRRVGDRLSDPGRDPGATSALEAAMARLEAALAVPAPPPLDEAARQAGCPPDGIRALVAAGRIMRLEMDLAWATPVYHRLAGTALGLARAGAVTPAALRDATGTSRRYVLAILEDLDRRGILERTPAGHVPGPRAPGATASTATAASATEPPR